MPNFMHSFSRHNAPDDENGDDGGDDDDVNLDVKKAWVVHYVLYRDFPLPDPLTLQCNPHDDDGDDDDRGNDDDANNVDGDNIDQLI